MSPPVTLVVDDDSIARLLMRKLLEQLGWIVHQANDGPTGLNLLNQQPISLCLVDWHMQPMDGTEFIARVRSEPRWSEVRLFMVSADHEALSLSQTRKLGAHHSMIKPLAIRTLIEALRLEGLPFTVPISMSERFLTPLPIKR